MGRRRADVGADPRTWACVHLGSAWSAAAPRSPGATTAGPPGSATSSSTISSSPTGCSSCSPRAPRWCSKGCSTSTCPYARLSTNLALDLDQPVQVNAYLSPVETKGLDLHFDYHDVIVVQLAGSKRWRVWEPIERTRRPAKSGAAIPLPQFDELGTPLVDLVMHAGDCLALPRGFPHAAETVDDESVHLTIGIMALTWERMLRNAIGEPSGTALADRLAVAGLESSYDPAAALDWLRTTIAGDRFRDEVAKAVWRRQPRTRLRPRRESFDLAADMPVRVTPGPLLWLTADGFVCPAAPRRPCTHHACRRVPNRAPTCSRPRARSPRQMCAVPSMSSRR